MSSVSYRQAAVAPVTPPGSHNVMLFGATGGGIVDDTTAIENAIAVVAQVGGCLYFPPGVYKVTRTIVIPVDGIYICGASKRACRIQFTPATNPDTLFLLESADGTPLQHVVIEHLEVRAAGDTTTTKYAFDLHGARHCNLRNIIVQGWSDTGRSSVALRIRGWDNLGFQNLTLDANYPVVIAQNDDGAGGFFDITKDLDHTSFWRCNLIADNALKIGVLFEDAVVHRNVTFDGIAMVHGGFYGVDVTEPRRRSTNLALKNIRFEGFAETTGTVVGKASVYFRRHANGKLRDLYMTNVLLAEGRDDRYGTTGANWNGIDVEGVIRKTLVSVTYGGEATPVSYNGPAPVLTGCTLTHSDNGKAKPANEAQWDQIGVPRPRSWWKFSTSSGSQTDQQDATLSGLSDRNLAVNGTPTYQTLVDGCSDYHITYTESANERFGLNSGLTDFNPNDRSAAWLWAGKVPAAWVPGGPCVLINLGSCAQVGAAGPNVYINASGLIETYAGSTVVTGAINYIGEEIAILAVYNRTAGTWIVYVARDSSDDIETITGTYSATVGSVNAKGFGAESGSFTSSKAAQNFGAMWFNTDAESLNANTLRSMGWGV